MKIIISPAKKMNVRDELPCLSEPVFLEQANELLSYLQSLTISEARSLWKCSDKLAELNYKMIQETNLNKNTSPAILSYEGIQYQYMAPMVMEQDWLNYIQQHLRILSGFYGILKPFDGVVPYRLEMQAKATVGGKKDLYDYWNNQLYRELIEDGDHIILNLASREYSRCVELYLQPEDTFITVIFGEWTGKKIIQKETLAKMARGEMVRLIAENQCNEPEEIQSLAPQGYRFQKDLSNDMNYVYIKQTSFSH